MKQSWSTSFAPSLVVSLVIGLIGLFSPGTGGMVRALEATMDPSPVTDIKNGWRIFMHGVTAQDRIVENSHGMEGVGCAMCHGQEGRGGSMHGMFAPNITFSYLSNPMDYQDPGGRRRPAYNEESVKAAIVAGIDAGGNILDPEMPRWTGLTAKDIEDLIQYLKTLGRPSREEQPRSEGI